MDINARKEKIKKWATVGLIGLAGLLVSPIIFLTIKGLIGLIIAALIGLTVITFAPVVAMKFANWRVKAIVGEAKQNPIETMTNLLIAKREAFERFKESVENAATARDTFKQKVKQFSEKYPSRAAEFQSQLERMTLLVERKKEALREARDSIEQAEGKLDEMKAYWDMSQEAQKANAASGMNTDDMFEKLKADTACDSVFESVNKAFAQLEIAASLEVDSDDKQTMPVAQLEHNAPVVLDVPVRQTQKVSAK